MTQNNSEQPQNQSFRLDLKNKKILYELDSNARQSCLQIGKKVGLSTEVVNYRLKKLEEENIITHYQTVINLSKLGVIQFKICLTLQHINSTKFEQIIGRLVNHKKVMWVVSCKGGWDIIISMEANSLQNVEVLKNEILALFEDFIYEKAISIAINASTFRRNYLIDKSGIIQERNILGEYEKIELDEIDLNILKKLSENARKSVIDIASELKTTPKTIHYRIRQLIKNNIITGFRIALNYKKLGIQFYKIFIYLDKPKKLRIDQFKIYLQNHKNVTHNVNVLGNWDFEPEFEVYSENEINKIVKELKDEFSDIIKKMDIITISQEHKFVYYL